MLTIGITGGIGSGKTTVCRIFETLGIPVFYADTAAKEIMITDQLLISGITAEFGPESYDAEGRLRTKHIAGIVFNQPDRLAVLNSLVHPAVFRAFDRWLAAVPAGVPYVMKEAALLFESGSDKACDRTVLVTAPEAVRIARVMQRDGATAAQVQARIDKQMSDAEKAGLAGDILLNDESQSVIVQAYRLHQQFLKLSV